MMSHFQDRFDNHAVHATIERCLESFHTVKLDNLTPEEVDAVHRSQHVVTFARDALAQCDADLVATGHLDQMNNVVTDVFNHWNQFIQTRSWEVLTQPCDNLLTHVAKLNSSRGPSPESFPELQASLRSMAAQTLKDMRETQRTQEEEANSFAARIDGFAQSVEQQAAQLEAQKSRMDSLINEHQATFQKAQEAKTQEFIAFLSDRNAAFETAQDDREAKAEELRSQHAEAGQRHIEELEAHRDHAKEIVGIIGNIGVTGNYQKIAADEGKAADLFRWIAVGCFGAMLVAVIVVLLVSLGAEHCDWTMALFRVLTAAIFIVPGIYCARESGKHRKAEQENRRRHLELASLSPFLEKLKDEAASKKILEKLAPEYFGDRTTDEEGQPLVNLDPAVLAATLKPVTDLLRALK